MQKITYNCVIIAVIVLLIIYCLFLSDKEKFDETLSNEAIQNIASVYNGEKLIANDIVSTQTLTSNQLSANSAVISDTMKINGKDLLLNFRSLPEGTVETLDLTAYQGAYFDTPFSSTKKNVEIRSILPGKFSGDTKIIYAMGFNSIVIKSSYAQSSTGAQIYPNGGIDLVLSTGSTTSMTWARLVWSDVNKIWLCSSAQK